MTEDEKKEFEQKGYDAWIELWIEYERSPNASMCPAKYMTDPEKRSAYIRGWNRARNSQ